MPGKLTTRRIILAGLLGAMLIVMAAAPLVSMDLYFTEIHITYFRALKLAGDAMSQLGSEPSVLGGIIWMILGAVCVIAGAVLTLVPAVRKGVYSSVSLVGALAVSLLLVLIRMGTKEALADFGEIGEYLGDSAFGIGFYLLMLLGIAASVLAVMALSGSRGTRPAVGGEWRESPPNYMRNDPPPAREGGCGYLVCLSGAYAGARFDLRLNEEIAIGRDPGMAHVVISSGNADVSRKHCTIRYGADTHMYTVMDYSKNGTYAGSSQGGERMRLPRSMPVQLPPGTILHIGKQENAFRLG